MPDSAKPQPPRVVKTTLSLPPEALNTLRELARARNTTLAEVVRRAVKMDKILAAAVEDGGTILVEKQGKTKELVII